MKTKVIITALATIALLVPGKAMAQHGHRNDMGGRMHHRTEFHFDNRHFDNRHHGNRAIIAHRPSMGARFVHRPAMGRFVTINRERLWLADGVIYKEMRIGNSIFYIVVGYV